ncbi:GIY-YIG nuclease family protein [Salibacteraceae bacterium]|nr:GIY-YIG nuclease family protein [Salibacteraceae bacterium]
MEEYWVYIIGNKDSEVVYVGMTNNLRRRIAEHKEGHGSVLTAKYNVNRLLYYDGFQTAGQAIAKEKQLKNWHREWKLNLIKEFNPEFRDLFEDI